MLVDYHPHCYSKNMVDNVDFTKDDLCIWVTYPPGGAGDLLSCIINSHYVNTGANYYGISDNGQVKFISTDYKMVNHRELCFNQQFFYDFAEQLGNRNLNFSLLDMVIFSNHLYKKEDVNMISKNFSKGKIIRLIPKTQFSLDIISYLSLYKNHNNITSLPNPSDINISSNYEIINNNQVLTIYFDDIFNELSFEQLYNEIISFLQLPGKLIRYDFIRYYIEKQLPEIRMLLNKL